MEARKGRVPVPDCSRMDMGDPRDPASPLRGIVRGTSEVRIVELGGGIGHPTAAKFAHSFGCLFCLFSQFEGVVQVGHFRNISSVWLE